MSIQDDIAAYDIQNQQKSNIQQDLANYKPDVQNQIAGASLPGSSNEPAKVDPDFLTKLDMINTGVHRGVTHFTLGLMSKLPFGDKYQQALRDEDARVQAAQDYNKKTYSGYYPQVGEIGGEMLATAPVGGLLGGVARGAAVVESALPSTLQTAGKFLTAGVGGAGVLAGMEGMKYDPNNPTGFNTGAAKNTLDNPLSYLIPAAGVGVSSWMDKAQELSQAKEAIPKIMARNLMEPGASKSIHDQIFGFLPSLTDTGKQVKLMKTIGEPVSNYVQKVSGLPEAMNSQDLIGYAGQQLQKTLQGLKKQGDDLWSAVPKDTPVKDSSNAVDLVNQAHALINDSSIAGKTEIINDIKSLLPASENPSANQLLGVAGNYGPSLTTGQLKDLQSYIGNAAHNAYELEGNAGRTLGNKLADIKDNLINHIQDSVPAADTDKFAAASQHSSMLFDLQSQSPLIKQAIVDKTAANDLIRKFIGTPKDFEHTSKAFNIMSPEGQQVTAAAALSQIMEKYNKPGGFNLGGFLDATKDTSQIPVLMGGKTSEAYQNLSGFNKHLQNINDASKVGWWRTFAMGTGLAGLAGGGLMHGGTTEAAIPVVSYLAANFVANHSPLKSIFNGVLKVLPASTEQYLTNVIQKRLTRAGFILDNNVFRHKDEQPVQTGEQQQ